MLTGFLNFQLRKLCEIISFNLQLKLKKNILMPFLIFNVLLGNNLLIFHRPKNTNYYHS